MADLKKKFNEIMKDLEKNIKNKDDLDYIKEQIYNISILFLDELDKIAEMNIEKMNMLAEKEKELGNKVSTMERALGEIEKEMFVSPDYDFAITCPYCNEEFFEDFSNGIKSEIKCPECSNVIELDWHEEDECGHCCDHEHHCHGEHEGCECEDEDIDDEEDDEDFENEDDM